MKSKSTMPIRILSSFGLTESALAKIGESSLFSINVVNENDSPPLSELISNYDALIASDESVIDASLLQKAENLKVVILAGIGLDNIDIDRATSLGILVMNTPKAHTITMAEHAISMLMALSRNIPQATASMKAGLWEKKKFMGSEVFNKVMGIVGLGKVGRVVADRARGMGMRVLATDPFISHDTASKAGTELVDMDRLLSESDYITIHPPQTAGTKNLISSEQFSKMKRGTWIINLSGPEIVNEEDLLRAIDTGIISGAAIDLFEEGYGGNIKQKLIKNEKIILTPHLGGYTEESYENVSMTVAQGLIDYFTDGIVSSPVNSPSLSPDTVGEISLFLELAEKLGRFTGQILESRKIEEVEITYLGKIADKEIKLVSLHLLVGMLSEVFDRKVNIVNAPVVVRESGIVVREEKSTATYDYSSEVRLEIMGNGERRLVVGAIVGNRPRVVKVDDYFIEAIPEGDILLVVNDDLPGVVGSIGTSLGTAEVNIGRMQLARDSKKEKNMIIINMDSPIEEAILGRLKKLPNVQWVKQVTL